jgi:hypothetical protein
MRETEGQTDTLPAEEIEFKSNHLKQPLWLRKHQDGKSLKNTQIHQKCLSECMQTYLGMQAICFRNQTGTRAFSSKNF